MRQRQSLACVRLTQDPEHPVFPNKKGQMHDCYGPSPQRQDVLEGMSCNICRNPSQAFGTTSGPLNCPPRPSRVGTASARAEGVRPGAATCQAAPGMRVSRSAMVIGNDRVRTPVACQTAFAMAPTVPVMPISPTPFTPSGFT